MRLTLYTSCLPETSFKNLGSGHGAASQQRAAIGKKRRKEVRRSADAPLRRHRIRRRRAAAAPRKPESKAHEIGFNGKSHGTFYSKHLIPRYFADMEIYWQLYAEWRVKHFR